MKFPTLFMTCLHVLLVLISFTFPVIGTITSVRCLDKERFTLLKIKADLKDKGGPVSEWGTEKECCRWGGVHCDNHTNHVVGLDIYSYNASGNISPVLLDLEYLNYLSLVDYNERTIPEFIGSLSKLQYLGMFYPNSRLSIPHQFGNLSMLRHLDLSGNSLLNITDLDWLSSLHSLEYLDLSFVNLFRATKWMQVINNLPNLNHLKLRSCCIEAADPPSYPLINTSTSLSFIDLSLNPITTTSILSRFLNVSRSFTYIDFSFNQMTGKIPDSLGNLTFLSYVDLSHNYLEGGVPTALWNSSMLRYLDFGENQLHGSLPNVLKLQHLEMLDLGVNGFFGSISDLTWCTSLRVVDLYQNKFNGTLTESIGCLSKLEILRLGSNNLAGEISEVHLFNLSHLQVLHLSSNANLRVIINSHSNPPFKLEKILLSDCNLGPKFPDWILKAYSQFASVDISNAQISGDINKTEWNSSICFANLNMSNNQISGVPPDLSCPSFITVDLSSNEFSGSLPLLSQNLMLLYLQKNKLSRRLSNICDATDLVMLDISDNQLSGHLPNCFMNLINLEYLNLDNNFLSGELPKSLGYLDVLASLYLRNNNFIGEIPTVLRKCGGLNALDLGENNFSGGIPNWIGTSFPSLAFLSLKSNEFYGVLPSTLCHLQNLHILDLSLNKISGTIPKCIGNFSSLTSKPEPVSSHEYRSPFEEPRFAFENTITITWKDEDVEYNKTPVFLKFIDLSSNKFFGQIPPEITSLHGLFALNISRNNLVGSIPRGIGQLEWLNFLDLSQNHLSGHIPASLSQLNHLGVLNLSFNNLSGRIPWNTHMQTFESSSYVGNLELCGHPLPISCPEDHDTHKKSNPTDDMDTMDKDELITTGFYISMSLGFILSFWGVLGTLILDKSCRYLWFKMLIEVNNWLYVKIVVTWNRMLVYFNFQ